ncbi:Hypothetical predicted protein [Octopus vulgaris]|uniref:Uncharacterized protein n=2 Tax=Octopus TaxID=6643 RepID=A0AA36BQF8_OCTVU|nr:uncharacterized protein LOC115222888 [Octopus sinensis]XP_036367906.1 uncharacterized protein LOC115222888 [Octopus sinensis]XP_036367907.1 uncharacterized protein LOC115222888 [Octopus sinensis]CAI9738373.1 Hypothetical predicted protein [Octopus vulgaris]
MLLKGTMGCGRSKPHSTSSLEEVDKDCSASTRKHPKSHACKKGDKSSHRIGSKKEVKGILKQQALQQHQMGRHHQVSSTQGSVQSQSLQRSHHRPLEQALRPSTTEQIHVKNSLHQKQAKLCPSKTVSPKLSSNQCHNDDSHNSRSNGSTVVLQYDGHSSNLSVVSPEQIDKRSADDKGSVNKKDQPKGEQTSKTAFKDKPSGKFYNTKITRSQLEFFRMLDEKIAQGKDYCSEEET